MEKSESEQLTFTSIKGRQVRADFGGGEVSSDGGLLLRGKWTGNWVWSPILRPG